MLCGNNAFYGGLLFSLDKTIIHGLVDGSSVILRIVRGESGFLVDSLGSVVLEQRHWQSGWWYYGEEAEQRCMEATKAV